MAQPGYIQIRNSDARAEQLRRIEAERTEVENEVIPEWPND